MKVRWAEQAGRLSLRPGLTFRDFAFALLAGGGALALNFLEVQLGWGLHFIFGNALIFAFLRVANPRAVVLAIAFASFRSVMLWGHPWAWLIWTAEAAVLAYSVHRTSPVRADVLFWLLLGTPLLILTYGEIMGMDQTSLMLVIGKQAVNGVLNVALGEALYLTFLIVAARRRRLRWPTVSIEATFLMFTMLTILVPTVAYLANDAPKREAAAREAVASRLEDRAFVAAATLDNWRQGREAALRSWAHDYAAAGAAAEQTADQLRADFSAIAILSPGGEVQALSGSERAELAGIPTKLVADLAPTSRSSAKIVVYQGPGGEDRLLLSVPESSYAAGQALALLRRDALARLLHSPGKAGEVDMYLVDPSGNPLRFATGANPALLPDRAISAAVLNTVSREATLVGPKTYGNSLMSDLKKAIMIRGEPLPGFAGWHVLAAMRLEPGVLAARKDQSVMFLTLFGLVVLMMLLIAGVTRRLEIQMRRIASAATEVTLAGTRVDRVDQLVIRELNEISVNLAIADTQVTRERSALVDYQRRLLSIATHAPVVVYALGRSGHDANRLLYIGDSIEKMLGYRTSEARTIGWLLRKIHPEDRPQYEVAIAGMAEGSAFEVEYRMRHRRGHWVWIYDTIAFASDPYFKRSEVVGLMIDVTDRKAAAEQLLQADKMAGLGQMVAGIAHELNQPLNFIRLAVDNLKERVARDLFDKERLMLKFEQVTSHVERAAAIIQQMRVFGRSASESPQPVRLGEVINAVLIMIRPQLAGHGITVDTSEVDQVLQVQARPNSIEQVLLNLFLNAQHAILSRGEEEPGLEGRITLRTHSDNDSVTLIFDDNGTGIPPDALKKLFDPFFTTKPPKQGMGLGLSISYEIIRELGGEITASNTGNGARFVIRLRPA